MRIALVGLLFICLTLSGCLKTTSTVLDETWAEWRGQKVENFFLRYGAPQASFEASEGRATYKWIGGAESGTYVMPQMGTTGSYAVNINYQCVIDIVTKDGLITKMKMSDTEGEWRLSRCDEVLNK